MPSSSVPVPIQRPLRAAPSALALALVLLTTACGSNTVTYGSDGVRLDEGPGKVGSERGEWTFRYFDGNLRARGNYDNDGRRTGTWETFFRNGQPANRGERTWVAEANGSLRTGPWIFWHENGFRRSKGIYQQGLREGPWEFWLSDGAPDTAQTGTYEAGLLIQPGANND